jgi:hypothetical protein
MLKLALLSEIDYSNSTPQRAGKCTYGSAADGSRGSERCGTSTRSRRVALPLLAISLPADGGSRLALSASLVVRGSPGLSLLHCPLLVVQTSRVNSSNSKALPY